MQAYAQWGLPAPSAGTSQPFSITANALNVFTGVEYPLGWLYTDRELPHHNTLYAAMQCPSATHRTTGASYLLASALDRQRQDWGVELECHAGSADQWITGLHHSGALRRHAYSVA